jgi:hypothetical protein
VSGLLVNVVLDGQELVCGNVVGLEVLVEVVLGVLDLVRAVVVIVYPLVSHRAATLEPLCQRTISVDIKVSDNVSQILHILPAAGSFVARRIRRTHVGGELLDNVADGHLVMDHLVDALLLGDGGEVLVRPRMAGDLVTSGIHLGDDGRPLGGSIIDSALAVVDTSDEESRLHIVLFEEVENIVSVDVWAVIVGDGDGTWLSARVKTAVTVVDISKLGTGNGTGVVAVGYLVSITARAVVDETIRSIAVLWGVTTPSLRLYQYMYSPHT